MRAVAALIVLAAATAHAHPRFEPTDLELEDSGTMEIDVQVGVVHGTDASRVVVPDFEVDLGIVPGVELDIDGAFGVEGHRPGPTFFDHQQRDNLWISAKLGLWDDQDPLTHDAWAIGVQAGPKLPIAPDTHGIGAEALLLVARMQGRVHLVAQVGALVDPYLTATPRPWGIEAGLDLDLDLDHHDTWSLLGEVGGLWYGSADASQLSATAGIQYSPSQKIDLSLVVMVGVLDGSDPYGVLFGVSPKLSLW